MTVEKDLEEWAHTEVADCDSLRERLKDSGKEEVTIRKSCTLCLVRIHSKY